MTAVEKRAQREHIVVSLLTAIATRDRPTAASCLTDDVAWWVPQSAAERGLERPLVGRERVLGLLCGESRYVVGSMAWEFHQILHDEPFVVAHCTLRATTQSGQGYENQYALLYRFGPELIAESWEHTDTAYAFARFSS